MTAVLSRGQGGHALRWLSSFGLVLSLHGSAAAFALYWSRQHEPEGTPPAALFIDLAPAAVSAVPAATPPQVPAPDSPIPDVPTPAVPTPDVPPLVPEPPTELHDAAELALPASLPEPDMPERQTPDIVDAEPPAAGKVSDTSAVDPSTSAAPATTAPADAGSVVAAAPEPSVTSQISGAVATWRAELLAHLERHKRYPREAQWLQQEGVVELYFAMDHNGHVVAARIETSSRSKALDQEALALVRRAQPLPLPPDGMATAHIELVVPVQFALKR